MSANLSQRIRPNSEAAPWVIEEVKAMEEQRDALAQALDDVLKVFRECLGSTAFSEFDGTSAHGPQVRSHRIVDAVALLKTVKP